LAHDEFILSLADGTRLALCAGDPEAVRVVALLAEAARLQSAPKPLPPGTRRLQAVVAGQQKATPHGSQPRYVSRMGTTDADAVCVLEPRDVQRPRLRRIDREGAVAPSFESLSETRWLWGQLARLSAAVGRETHQRGGVLLHSGLAALPVAGSHAPSSGQAGRGVLLAGRSGVGKSTATRRLPIPWRSLADDVTLVVRGAEDPQSAARYTRGAYWAHPWPTWSWFFGEEARAGGGRWDVQRAVPLQAIVFLEQGPEDRTEPVGPGRAVCLLAELARQTSTHYLRGSPLEEIVAFNLRRFENLCGLVRAVPAYLLHVSLGGAFWEKIEAILASDVCAGDP
jgi:SynChlorMet cassette protein ScmC